ncbi:MAG: ATP-binding domain-containing protein, partial [Enterococcus hulanensis]
QGSEFKMVLLPMVKQYSRMLQRNLLYTAVTRSKELLILLGEEEAFQACVNRESAVRKTTLIERITKGTEVAPVPPKAEPFKAAEDKQKPAMNEPTILTPNLVAAQTIDPMIGMENITPAMFM